MTLTWDTLYADPRHHLRYPSEHCVRFLSQFNAHEHPLTAIDIGCGTGRHLKLLSDQGFITAGVDTAALIEGEYGDMTDLRYPDDMFDVALAYSVYHYGTHTDHVQAVNELHRVLKPEGHALIAIRTNKDWRAAGIPPGEPEHGMPMTFTHHPDIPTIYAAFTPVSIELAEFTTHQQTRLNSDWLITVTK